MTTLSGCGSAKICRIFLDMSLHFMFWFKGFREYISCSVTMTYLTWIYQNLKVGRRTIPCQWVTIFYFHKGKNSHKNTNCTSWNSGSNNGDDTTKRADILLKHPVSFKNVPCLNFNNNLPFSSINGCSV